MSDQTTPQPEDDTEGHGISRKFLDTEAATEDDTEGHRMSRMDSEAATEDDVEGHGGIGLRPDKQLDSDDVEGHVNFIQPDGPQDQA